MCQPCFLTLRSSCPLCPDVTINRYEIGRAILTPTLWSMEKQVARIAGVNIPTNKRVIIALTYIHGIGRATAVQIANKLGIDHSRREIGRASCRERVCQYV